MIKAVILDAYGTIFNTGTGSVDMMREILRQNGREDLDASTVYTRFKQFHRQHIDTLESFITEA